MMIKNRLLPRVVRTLIFVGLMVLVGPIVGALFLADSGPGPVVAIVAATGVFFGSGAVVGMLYPRQYWLAGLIGWLFLLVAGRTFVASLKEPGVAIESIVFAIAPGGVALLGGLIGAKFAAWRKNGQE